ncbi:MAG: Holliday junction branch migration DNA helicase RuvB [bacterium]|jgi:Holliday junction DNA helicase RuvB
MPRPEDAPLSALRPRTLAEYVGQEQLKSNLSVMMRAAKSRGEPLEHVLFSGPPGLGKTTLAHIIAAEMGSEITATSGPALERAGDLVSILTNLGRGDVLFIDEIHRMNRVVEETLYPAMEDFVCDIVLGKGPGAKSIRLPLERFTLVGATTRSGLLTAPLRERFGALHHLELYPPNELVLILKRSAGILKTELAPGAAESIAARSRGTPRVANRLLKRVRDFAQVEQNRSIDAAFVDWALGELGIDALGLERMDRRILSAVAEKFQGGPVGMETLVAVLGEESDTLTDVYEPYLLQLGFLVRTPRGRIATRAAYEYLGLPFPEHLAGAGEEQRTPGLFE